MNRALILLLAAIAAVCPSYAQPPGVTAKRIVLLKVDGLNADLLFQTIAARDPATGKSLLPWFDEVFSRNGVTFNNFFTRGISLSAPSWSMLDTGHHLIIKGNVEYDRYTGRVYDYLNFFPFYLGYVRLREVDMPSVRVLDQAGIPLLIDHFPYDRRYQSFQLFQRGVQWETLTHGLKERLSRNTLLSIVEDPGAGLGLDEGLEKETEDEILRGLAGTRLEYLDLFTGDVDHLAHSVNDPRVLQAELKRLDSLLGRLWSGIQASPLAHQTILAVVSDHGMNNAPGIISQTFSLPDLLNSTRGGAHHVVTNRHQLSDFKIAGLNPLVFRVVTPSTASFYLKGQAEEYPTAWLDLDGNERAAVCLRNSDLNKIHILLQQLSRSDLPPPVRTAAERYLKVLLDRKRVEWRPEMRSLSDEIRALSAAITVREREAKSEPKKWTAAQREMGLDKEALRKASELNEWVRERDAYQEYLRHQVMLLDLHLEPGFNVEPGDAFPGEHPSNRAISGLVPPMSLGDPNTLYDLQHYVAGPAPAGLTLDGQGEIDEPRSFRFINYFPLCTRQTVRNNPQRGLSPLPVDFVAHALPPDRVAASLGADGDPISQAIWLYADDDHQLLEVATRRSELMKIRLIPVAHLRAEADGALVWQKAGWTQNLPLRLFEDQNLILPRATGRAEWLSRWHTEREWFNAIYACRYSNGVIGITEELLPPALALPELAGKGALAELELRKRDLVQPDLHLFAADHWNFNVRNFNPGGNHGSFLRISTHSVWMMAGGPLPSGLSIDAPYDSLNFTSTILELLGMEAVLPDRQVRFDGRR